MRCLVSTIVRFEHTIIRPFVLSCEAMTETVDLVRDRPPRKQRSDGERSRNAILREAAQLATVEGIDGLSIGRLAEAVGMSKSGLFAHFGSKQELQLATIETASGPVQRARGRACAGRCRPGSSGCGSSRRTSCCTSRRMSIRAAASSPRSPPRWTRARARCATPPSAGGGLGPAFRDGRARQPDVKARSTLQRISRSSPSNSIPTCSSPMRSSSPARSRRRSTGRAAHWSAASERPAPERSPRYHPFQGRKTARFPRFGLRKRARSRRKV